MNQKTIHVVGLLGKDHLGGEMSSIGRRAVVSASAICAMLAATGCPDGDKSKPVSVSSPSPSTSQGPPYAQSGDGGTVRVVEKGFSTARDRGNRPRLSYGFVLENTSRRAIVAPTIKISFTDTSGHRLEINPGKLYHSTPLIFPGQRHGMGGTFGLLAARKARKLEIEIASPLWVPVGTPPSTVNQAEFGTRFAEVKASRIRAERTRGRMRLTFTVESGYTTALTNPHFTVVFRDRSGKIVGGSDDYIKPDTKLEPGGSTHFFETWEGLPDGTVDQRSQVYIDPS